MMGSVRGDGRRLDTEESSPSGQRLGENVDDMATAARQATCGEAALEAGGWAQGKEKKRRRRKRNRKGRKKKRKKRKRKRRGRAGLDGFRSRPDFMVSFFLKFHCSTTISNIKSENLNINRLSPKSFKNSIFLNKFKRVDFLDCYTNDGLFDVI